MRIRVKVKSWEEIVQTLDNNLCILHCGSFVRFKNPMAELCGKTIEGVVLQSGVFVHNGVVWSPDWVDRVYDELADEKSPSKFTEFLENAIELEKQRGKDYDSPSGERSAESIAKAFNAITGHDLTESEIWLILTLLKQVRQWSNTAFHRDSAEDQVTYVDLMSESLAAGKKSTKR